VLTCGGSGLSLRDVTPEATRDVCEREVPGIAEAMRYHSLQITPYAMLSRAICMQRGRTIVINLPGSTKAATENWEGIVDALPHAVKMMAGEGHNK
jgi:molybdenum cofactor synthesis domain-containing protein